ncbi:MAG: hypothetical protein ABR499_13405 [Gemmatimonadaceae bacterium]
MRSDEIPQQGSAYDVIAAARPEFLRPRAGTFGQPVLPAAYLDGVQLAELDMLRLVLAAWVLEIRYLRAPIASARLRRNLEAGAILVTTKR